MAELEFTEKVDGGQLMRVITVEIAVPAYGQGYAGHAEEQISEMLETAMGDWGNDVVDWRYTGTERMVYMPEGATRNQIFFEKAEMG